MYNPVGRDGNRYELNTISAIPAVPSAPHVQSNGSSRGYSVISEPTKGKAHGKEEIYNALLEGGLEGKSSGEDYLSLYIRLHPDLVEEVIREEPSLLTEGLIQNYPELTQFFPRADLLLELNPYLFQMGGAASFHTIYGDVAKKNQMRDGTSSHWQRVFQEIKKGGEASRVERWETAEGIGAELRQNLTPQEKNEFIQAMLMGRSWKEQRSILIQIFKYEPELFYPEIFQAFPLLERDYPGLKGILKSHPDLLQTTPGFLGIAYGDTGLSRGPRYSSPEREASIARMVGVGIARGVGVTLEIYLRTVIAAYEYQYGCQLAGRSDLGSQFLGYYFMSSAYSTSGGNILYLFPNRYGNASSNAVIGFNQSLISGLRDGALNFSHGVGETAHRVNETMSSIQIGKHMSEGVSYAASGINHFAQSDIGSHFHHGAQGVSRFMTKDVAPTMHQGMHHVDRFVTEDLGNGISHVAGGAGKLVTDTIPSGVSHVSDAAGHLFKHDVIGGAGKVVKGIGSLAKSIDIGSVANGAVKVASAIGDVVGSLL